MIGKQIGRYRISEEIGRGGMGIVYKAIQVTLNRTVAVKMLPQDLAAAGEYLARFRREAETLASLQHPNIVHIYDVDEYEGSHFIIMEYVGGPPLTRRLQRSGRLQGHEVRQVAMDLASALEAAHKKDIIHRDIKPDNILFSEDGTPKLTDFGIARMRDSNVKTRTGVMLGTPYYMSPEQVSGTPVTGASDVYSLGVVMYEMISGRVPFSADTPVAVALKHLQEAAAPLHSVVPSASAELCSAIDRAMAKEPRQRYETAAAFRRALRGIRIDVPAPAPPPSACPRCGTGLLTDFRTCPGCGTAMDELRALVPVVAPPARPAGDARVGAAVRDAVESVRDAADAARDAAGAGLGRLAQAGDAVAGSAGAALGRVARSAGAVVRRSDREDESASSTPKPEADRAARPGLLDRLPFALPPLTPIAWIGIALVLGGLLVATLMGLALNGSSATTDFAVLPPTSPPARSQDISPMRPPSSRVIGTVERADSTRETERQERGTGDEETRRQPESTPDSDPSDGPAEDDTTEEDGEPLDRETPEQPADSVSSGPVTREATDGKDDAVDSDAAEAAARQAILAIAERQRRATETNDGDLFLADLHPDARSHDGTLDRDAARRSLRDLHRGNREIESTISDVRVTFPDATHAVVRFQSRIRAIPRGEQDARTLAEGQFTWELELEGGRWLIVRF